MMIQEMTENSPNGLEKLLRIKQLLNSVFMQILKASRII